MKRCVACGETKENSNFRSYYGGRNGTYSYCKACESIEARRKHLIRTNKNPEEIAMIEELYDAKEAAGLKPPSRMRERKESVTSLIEKQLAAYKEKDLG